MDFLHEPIKNFPARVCKKGRKKQKGLAIREAFLFMNEVLILNLFNPASVACIGHCGVECIQTGGQRYTFIYI